MGEDVGINLQTLLFHLTLLNSSFQLETAHFCLHRSNLWICGKRSSLHWTESLIHGCSTAARTLKQKRKKRRKKKSTKKFFFFVQIP